MKAKRTNDPSLTDRDIQTVWPSSGATVSFIETRDPDTTDVDGTDETDTSDVDGTDESDADDGADGTDGTDAGDSTDA
jgi:hypothetical protein